MWYCSQSNVNPIYFFLTYIDIIGEEVRKKILPVDDSVTLINRSSKVESFWSCFKSRSPELSRVLIIWYVHPLTKRKHLNSMLFIVINFQHCRGGGGGGFLIAVMPLLIASKIACQRLFQLSDPGVPRTFVVDYSSYTVPYVNTRVLMSLISIKTQVISDMNCAASVIPLTLWDPLVTLSSYSGFVVVKISLILSSRTEVKIKMWYYRKLVSWKILIS